jgi:hypothetical protein
MIAPHQRLRVLQPLVLKESNRARKPPVLGLSFGRKISEDLSLLRLAIGANQ